MFYIKTQKFMEHRVVYFQVFNADDRLIESNDKSVYSSSWTDARKQIAEEYRGRFPDDDLTFIFK